MCALPRYTRIKRRRVRHEKLQRLRKGYYATKDKREREKILKKAGKIAPWLSPKQFLSVRTKSK